MRILEILSSGKFIGIMVAWFGIWLVIVLIATVIVDIACKLANTSAEELGLEEGQEEYQSRIKRMDVAYKRLMLIGKMIAAVWLIGIPTWLIAVTITLFM